MVQTFLPYPDFKESAGVLDSKRLGAQINEVQTIAGIFLELHHGYENHPVTKMWRGYDLQLIEFGLTCEDEWESRGFKERSNRKTLEWYLECASEGPEMGKPPWFGRVEVHQEYQGLLVWKDPAFYGPKFPGVQPIDQETFRYPTEF